MLKAANERRGRLRGSIFTSTWSSVCLLFRYVPGYLARIGSEGQELNDMFGTHRSPYLSKFLGDLRAQLPPPNTFFLRFQSVTFCLLKTHLHLATTLVQPGAGDLAQTQHDKTFAIVGLTILEGWVSELRDGFLVIECSKQCFSNCDSSMRCINSEVHLHCSF